MLSEKTKTAASLTAHQFQNQKPFKYVIIDDFLTTDIINGLVKGFPMPVSEEMLNEYGKPNLKHTISNIRSINQDYKNFDTFLQSFEFLTYLENITGIENLIFDPNYFGGGTHNNLSGQSMDTHVDFNLLDIPRIGTVHRRLNVIIYLNEEWKREWGGCLEFHSDPYEPESDEIEIVTPIKNRMVLFETNEYSWHGFEKVTETLPAGLSRKSIAIYYYSLDRPESEKVSQHGTFYVPKIEANEPFDYIKFSRQRAHALSLIKNLYKKEISKSEEIESRDFIISELKKLLPPEKDKLANFQVKVLDWGPVSYTGENLPNLQPDGSIGLWIKLNCENIFHNLSVILNEKVIISDLVFNKNLVTAAMPSDLFDQGSVRVQLVSQFDHFSLPIGLIVKSDG